MSRQPPRALNASIAVTAGILVLLTSTACDTWKEPFRVKDPKALVRAAARTPLPATAFRVRWDSHTTPSEIARAADLDVRISFTNLSDDVWPDTLAADPVKRDGGYSVRLVYAWTTTPADPAARPARRADLPRPVRPGESMTLLVPIEAPDRPGEYQLTFELVQELVAWFESRGATKLVVPVTIR